MSTFVEALYNRYKNQPVEIFTNTTTGIQKYSDYELQEQSVIDGEIIDFDGDMLIIKTYVTTPNKDIECEVAINGWQIQSVVKKEFGVSILSVYGGQKSYNRKR